MPSFADLVGSHVAQVPQTVFARGDELERVGAVQVVRFAPTAVTAEVDDAAARVEFTMVEGALQWYCTCADGRRGAFCTHCTATALAHRRCTGSSA